METSSPAEISNQSSMATKDKNAKKTCRKQAKALQLVMKDFTIEESEEACINLMVCNAGLVTGCSKSDLLSVFAKFGPLQNLVMIPKKSYSFVIYHEVKDAKEAMEKINGKIGFNEKGPIYLAFTKTVPSVDTTWTDKKPPGLTLIQDFVDGQLEQDLLRRFEDGLDHSTMKNRSVKHFGFEFDYKTNSIDPEKPLKDPIPGECKPILDKLESMQLVPELPDQLTVNVYSPGQGIPFHVDSHTCCSDWLISISLGSGTVMEFRGPEGEEIPVWLPPRSLVLLRDEARYCWKHGISPRHTDIIPDNLLDTDISGKLGGLTLHTRGLRVSLTLRKTVTKPCECSYPRFCNQARKETATSSMMSTLEKAAAQIESQLVHQVYEEIAEHFSDTRHKPWPKVVDFLKTLRGGGLLVDLGCGNGKYLGLGLTSPDLYQIGGDFSHNLLKIVRNKGVEAVRLDLLSPGVRDNVACGIICIAALHHLASEERRLKAVQEMARILEHAGRMLVYVWAKDQKKENMSSYLKQNKNNFKTEGKTPSSEEAMGEFGLPVHVNRTQFKAQDVLVPWKLKEIGEEDRVFRRYYHVFEEGELEDLLEKAGNLKVIESYYDQGNWCVIAEKI